MAKLKGKAKAAFLRRMAAGRRKAAKVVKKVRTKRRKTAPKRRKAQSTNTRKKRRNTVAKKRGSPRKSKFGIPSIVKKAAAGIGLATIAVTIVSQVAPQAAPIVRPIAAFIGGGLPGVVSDLILSGGAGFLGNIFGGGQSVNGGGELSV